MTLPTPSPELVLSAMLDAHHPVKVKTADWARAHLDPGDMIERDRASVFFVEAWKACAEEGLLGSLVPVADGGIGDDLITGLLKLEGLGLGCRDNGFGFALASQVLSFQDALLRFGTDEQRQRVLRPTCAGDIIGAFAITEPGSGSDTYAMATTATPAGDGWVLNGTKSHITLGPVADQIVVFAVTDPDAGRWGISAFLVPADRPGLTQTPNHEKMGLRTTPFGDIELVDVEVGDADLLGRPGAGVSIFQACMESERGLILSTQLGAAERVLDQAVERARTRQQFGRPIGAFQAVSHRLVDMRVQLDTARLHMYKAAASMAGGGRSTMAAAMSKLVGSEALVDIAMGASRIHGARGYVTDYEVERELRDALGSLVYSGTSDIQRNLIAALMGVGGKG